MNRHLRELISLSKVDKELDGFNPQIEKATKRVDEQKRVVKRKEDEIKKLLKQIDDNREKIDVYEEKIPKLSQQLKDIDKKRKLITSEKELKALMSEEDVAKGNLHDANSEIERLNRMNEMKELHLQELQEEKSLQEEKLAEIDVEVNSELEEIEKQKESLYQQREQITHRMDQKILSFYEKIRKWAGNSAVVMVRKQACYGCYLKISDKTYSDVIRGNEIITCPHCGRILYIEQESKTQEA